MSANKVVFLEYSLEKYRQDFLFELSKTFSITYIVSKSTFAPENVTVILVAQGSYKKFVRIIREMINSFKYFRTLQRVNPDIIVSGDLGLKFLLAAIYSNLYKRKLIAWAKLTRNSEASRTYFTILIRKILIHFSTAIIVNSESGKEYMRSITNKPVHIIHQASIDVANYGLKYRNEFIERDRILFLGRIEKDKGVDVFTDLASHFRNTEFTFVFIGDGSELKNLKIKFKHDRNILFLGWLDYDEISKWICTSGLLVFPTLGDEWGLVLVEALGLGTPVLASNRSGAGVELFQNSLPDLLFDPGSKMDFFKKFTSISELSNSEFFDLKKKLLKIYSESGLHPKIMAEKFKEVFLT